ncbi:MAG: PilZ domain-containing protein [Candidatus Omnitrophota bacterium]|nr:MAG: PilZ domain-containing protein [Candidatus Omnitrophota bacterium]
MEERRKFIRLSIDVDVTWKKVTKKLKKTAKSKITKNIGGGGICLITYGKEFEVGDILQLKIMLPSKKVVRTKGKVVWINEFEVVSEKHEKRYDIGVEFLDIDDKDRELIKRFVFTTLTTAEEIGQ